jgi:hypothetical protein
MATSSSTNTVLFATANVIYRLFLVQSTTTNTLEALVGMEGQVGYPNNAIGSLARFTKITAIGVDFDVQEATIAVVGDGDCVRMINIFTREVSLLGFKGDIGEAGGVAISKRNNLGNRIAYVSDVLNNKIKGYDLESRQAFFLAGSGAKGSGDGKSVYATFWAPRGLAFLDQSDSANVLLLVADSKNHMIRVIDTTTYSVTTWFKPLDKINPELSNPVGLSVSIDSTNSGRLPMVYVSEAGRSVSVIQRPFPADINIKIITSVLLSSSVQNNVSVSRAVPLSTSPSINGDAQGYNSLLIYDEVAHSLHSLIQDVIAVSTQEVGKGLETCHIPCKNSQCAILSEGLLCGNSFLDPLEECDTASAPGSGCTSACKINTTAFACPRENIAVPTTRCLAPRPAYNYAHTNTMYYEGDCLSVTPRSGFTIDNKCIETDINECNEGTHNCSAKSTCANTLGSFKCLCYTGYFGDGYKCAESAYAVYTVVDIPSLPSASLRSSSTVTSYIVSDAIQALKNAYAAALTVNIPDSIKNTGTFLYDTATMAQLSTTFSLDPSVNASARFEIVSLFETASIANMVAASTNAAALNLAMSKAFFGVSITTGVAVLQPPKTRIHRGSSFTTANIIEGWGMNITSVSFNRSCIVTGVTPRGGCWQVEMIYMGGQSMAKSDESLNNIQQTKNLLYLPRIDHDPVTMLPISPMQTLSVTGGISFPCDYSAASAAGRGMTYAATACCMRDINTTYRTHEGFKAYLESGDYNGGAPLDTCQNQVFNDTFPMSDIAYKYDKSIDGTTNDLVVGKLSGMPNSEVRLLETIDYTTRTFRVLLVLEENDLRLSASVFQGDIGTSYNMTFFVGLANFKGTGTSVLSTKNMQEFITVQKSNILTISSYGANQDPLVSAVDLSLIRVKVTDYFKPIKYLYYLKPLFIMPKEFTAIDSAIVPLGSIRIIKADKVVTAADPAWQQVCSSDSGSYINGNTSLRSLITRAQAQPCVEVDMQMCKPPVTALSLVTFGVPLPEDFITDDDFTSTETRSIQVQFMINAKDISHMTVVRTTLTLSIDLTRLSYRADCETISASQTLADIISGDIYIGTATNKAEWDTTMLKKTNIDAPGTTPSNSFQFNTTTVQGAVMTFSALGDPKYFEDTRNSGQSVHINDVHTVHFLEPLGGKGGPSPNFDAVKALFLAGKAFDTRTDPTNHTVWLTPSAALINICPYTAQKSKMTCLTRSDSTFKNSMITRKPNVIVEIRTGSVAGSLDATSEAEVQNIMSQVMMQGGVNDYTKTMGTGFYTQLKDRLSLNNRYRKAYVINPVIDWSMEAMNGAFPGSTAFTVCTKIIAIGMVTITSANGSPVARRLLSSILENTPPTQDFFWPLISPPKPLSKSPTENLLLSHLRNNKHHHHHNTEHGGRSLLQVSDPSAVTDLSPSKEQTSNSLVLDLNVPGYDSCSQMCSLYLGAPFSRCNIVQLQTQIKGENALKLCASKYEGTLPTSLDSGLSSNLKDTYKYSQVKDLALLDVTVDGCDQFSQQQQQQSGRRLLQQSNSTTAAALSVTYHDYNIVVTQKVILSSFNGTAIIYTDVFKYLTNFYNSTTWLSIIAGGGYLTTTTATVTYDGNGGAIINIDTIIKNSTMTNTTKFVDDLKRNINTNPSNGDQMFVYDNVIKSSSSTSLKTPYFVFGINIITIVTLIASLFFTI